MIPVADPFALTKQDAQAGEYVRLPITPLGAKVLARDAKGNPVATSNRHGKGEAIFFGTALALGYHRHPDPVAGDWIAAPARDHARKMAVSAATEAPRVFFRGMGCPDGSVAILTNPYEACRVRVTFQGDFGDVKNVLAGEPVKTVARGGATDANITVPAGGVTILLAQPKSK